MRPAALPFRILGRRPWRMNYPEFRALAREVFESIPEEYRHGISGIDITARTVRHPTLPDIYTLGECLTETYPSDYGGPGEVRSTVVLHFGSFLELARTREEWDWDAEVWETITHEVRHHLESLAADEGLEEEDYAVDQNFLRRKGGAIDPFFYRYGTPVGAGQFEIDGDFFIERELDPKELGPGALIRFRWGEQEYRVKRPVNLGDVHYLRLQGVETGGTDPDAEVLLVLVRIRSLWEWVGGLFRDAQIRIDHSDAQPERV